MLHISGPAEQSFFHEGCLSFLNACGYDCDSTVGEPACIDSVQNGHNLTSNAAGVSEGGLEPMLDERRNPSSEYHLQICSSHESILVIC